MGVREVGSRQWGYISLEVIKALTTTLDRHMQKGQQHRAKLYGLYNLLVWLLIDVSAKTRCAISTAGSTWVILESHLKGTPNYPLVGDRDGIRESKMWLK